RYGLTVRHFPPRTQFINSQPGFWQQYGTRLLLVILSLLLVMIVIFLIWTESRRRQLSDEQLHERTQLIRNILDSIPDLIFYKDSNGIYVFCNKQFTRVMGKNPIGQTDYDVFDHETASFSRAKDNEAIARKNMNMNEEW